MTIDRAVFILNPRTQRNSKSVHNPTAEKQKSLFDRLCFANRLSKQQLVDMPIETITLMMRDIDRSLIINENDMRRAMKMYAANRLG